MTTADEREARFRAHGFTMHCDCPDEAAPYEPCESCGTRVGFSHGRCVEDNLVRGCSTEGGGHCQSWTAHTPKRCREMRSVLPPIEAETAMTARHTEDCIYSGQAEKCDGTCVQHEEEKAA